MHFQNMFAFSKSLIWLQLCLWNLALIAAGPQLRPPVKGDSGVSIEWTAPGESAFTVQSRDSLVDGAWVSAPSGTPWPVGTNAWIDSRPGAGQRFYRVLAVQPASRGKIISSSQIAAYSTFELGFIFQLGGVPVTAKRGVTLHKLVYETIDPWGGRTQASGLVVLPQGTSKSLPMASYQHGTLVRKSDAPSSNSFGERVLGLAFAATEYAAVLPDYLGLGESPGTQPYHHARSQASACVDMLRAARSFCRDRGVALNGQLFLAGYSHGGHVTMSLLRELETYHSDEFQVTAAAPMAGAYDLSGVTMDDFLSDRAQPNPYYAGLLIAMVQNVYQIAPSLADLLAEPYNRTLPPLLDGSHSSDEINSVVPSIPKKVLKPEVLAAIVANPNHPLRAALRDNDVHSWRPRSNVRMYHCRSDRDVIIANSEVAFAYFQSAGADKVQLVDPLPSADHGGCSAPSLLAAKAWFDGLQQ